MYAGKIVERAPTAELFSRPLHPYTIGLIAARPTPGASRSVPLRTIPGMVPLPHNFPSGCRFHPRCAYAQFPRCQTEPAELREVTPGHFVRCHFAGELDVPQNH